MSQPFNKIQRHSAVDFVLDQFKEAFLQKKICLNERLPSEENLAETFGVGRSTIREALQHLKAYGVLEAFPSKGMRVVSDFSSAYGKLSSLNLAIDSETLVDVQQYRQIIELGSVANILANISSEDFSLLHQLNDSLLDENQSMETAADIDFRFHYTLLKIGQNKTALAVYESIAEVIHQLLKRGRNRSAIQKGHGEHQKILNALQEKDLTKTTEYLFQHLEEGIHYLKKSQFRKNLSEQ